jgi:quercetin 2,3-dioxygenase
MFEVFPAESRYQVDLDWLRSRLSFSFGEYFDANNTAFGVLRVCNHDEVGPGKGFGAHPHSDMEIVTVVLSGAIKHEDNLGNRELTSAGEVQRMTAGSGIIHAEYNVSETEPVKILQLWFMPAERGLAPSYETRRYDPEKLRNAWLPVVDPVGSDQSAKIHQDMTINLSRIDKGKELIFTQPEGRRIFLFVIEGQIAANKARMGEGDTARIESLTQLTVAAEDDAFVMLIDLP